jgi:glutaredoxin
MDGEAYTPLLAVVTMKLASTKETLRGRKMPQWFIRAKHRSDTYHTFTREACTDTAMLKHVLDAIDGNYAEIEISKYRHDKGQKKLKVKTAASEAASPLRGS